MSKRVTVEIIFMKFIIIVCIILLIIMCIGTVINGTFECIYYSKSLKKKKY